MSGLRRYYGWSSAVVGSALFLWVVISASNYADERDRQFEQTLRAARQNWFADCHKPIEDCAFDWDSSKTLRQIYFDRAKSPA